MRKRSPILSLGFSTLVFTSFFLAPPRSNAQAPAAFCTDLLSAKVKDQPQIEIFKSAHPEDLESLHPDVREALKKLNEVYESQEFNTVDVFEEQALLKGKSVDYVVAKNSQGEVIGLLAFIKASNDFPTSLARFGVKDASPVQIELGRALVTEKGLSLFRALLRTGTAHLQVENLELTTPVYFWADDPRSGKVFMLLGGPPFEVSQKGIFAFKTAFSHLVEKFGNR